MLFNSQLVGGNNFGMCGVHGRIFRDELEVVLNALALSLRETKTFGVLIVYPRRK